MERLRDMGARICIIGYGNPQMGDDGVGPLVVGRLRASLGPRAGVRFFTCQQLEGGLLDELVDAHLLILVDASVEELPCEVMWRRVQPRPRLSPFTHRMDPSTLVWLLEATAGSSPETWVVSIKGERFEMEEGVSPRALCLAVRAQKEIEAFLKDRARSAWPAGCLSQHEPNPLACVG